MTTTRALAWVCAALVASVVALFTAASAGQTFVVVTLIVAVAALTFALSYLIPSALLEAEQYPDPVLTDSERNAP